MSPRYCMGIFSQGHFAETRWGQGSTHKNRQLGRQPWLAPSVLCTVNMHGEEEEKEAVFRENKNSILGIQGIDFSLPPLPQESG